MPAVPSSTCATVGSRLGSTNSKSGFKHNSKPTTMIERELQAQAAPPTDEQDFTNQRIGDYVADSIDANPRFSCHTVEESVKDHIRPTKAYLDRFDRVMGDWEG